jgi:hypothetical protein
MQDRKTRVCWQKFALFFVLTVLAKFMGKDTGKDRDFGGFVLKG